MFFQKKPFIIRKSPDTSLADFFLSYQSIHNTERDSIKSYQILSSLKQQHDMIMEIDSQLTSLPTQSDSQIAFTELFSNLNDLGIDYRDRKFQVKETKGFFGIQTTSNKTHTAHRIIAYLPNKLWNEEHFKKIIPHFGVRYYICKEHSDLQKLLEEIEQNQVGEEEMKEHFTFIIYDCISSGHMGIKTSLTLEELEQRITLS